MMVKAPMYIASCHLVRNFGEILFLDMLSESPVRYRNLEL